MSMSHRSLIVHPAPLITKAPTENLAIIHSSGNDPTGATIPILHMHGHNSSHVPIGLSKRANKAYGCSFAGKALTIDRGALLLAEVLIAFLVPRSQCNNEVESGRPVHNLGALVWIILANGGTIGSNPDVVDREGTSGTALRFDVPHDILRGESSGIFTLAFRITLYARLENVRRIISRKSGDWPGLFCGSDSKCLHLYAYPVHRYNCTGTGGVQFVVLGTIVETQLQL